jgi:hypothetical protein
MSVATERPARRQEGGTQMTEHTACQSSSASEDAFESMSPAESTPQEPARRRRSVKRRIAVLVSALVMGLLFMTASPAEAYTSASGQIGPSTTLKPLCQQRINGYVNLQAKGPQVYAYNYRSGGGNDVQWVRYYVRAVDDYGRIAQTSGWSAWVLASDNVPATWSGVTDLTVNANGRFYKLDYVIEWYNSGWAVQRMTDYLLYNSIGVGPYSGYSWCGMYQLPS